jgi:6-phosphogluconolactonase
MSNKGRISRRDFLTVGAAGSLLLLAQRAKSSPSWKTSELTLYVGTYTSSTKSEGIYVCGFDPETGRITLRHTVKNVVDPSFLTIDKSNKYLYAVNELVEYEGKPSGSVSAFAIEAKTGDLKFLNKQPSLGGAPCHITLSANGKYVLVANYLGGNVSVFPVGKDGRIGATVGLVQHTGSGPNQDRQLAPHAHSINLDRRNRYAFVADLGIDRVMIYEFDGNSGKLRPNPLQPYFQTRAGAGPRHFAFHPNGKLAFVINELDSSISSLAYDSKAGTLREIQTISTLSPDFKGVSACADIHVSPDGRLLYGSNRGEDSIAVFGIDGTSGKITNIENTPTGGKRPRNFAIDPTGAYLLAANQDTGNIVVFRIDKTSGKLKRTEHTLEIPAPVCLKFAPVTT